MPLRAAVSRPGESGRAGHGRQEEPEMDLIVRGAQLADRPRGELVDIGVEAGRIVAVAPRLDAETRIHEAAGRLTCAGLIETHIHLDKSRLLERCPAEPGRIINPVRYVEPFKKDISEEDIYRRA